MNEKVELLKKIDIENFIWIIYLGIIFLCFYGNYYEKNYLIYNNPISKEKYRDITIIIFSVALAIYIYFFNDNLDSIKKGNFKSQKEKDLNELSLIASTLILISGIIFLYIAITDKDLDVELAFN